MGECLGCFHLGLGVTYFLSTVSVCGKKYKHKPGLTYHMQHVHADEMDADEDYTPSGRQTPSSTVSDDLHSTSSRTSTLNAQRAVAAAASGEECFFKDTITIDR